CRRIVTADAVVTGRESGLDVSRVNPTRRALPRLQAQRVELPAIGGEFGGFDPRLGLELVLDLLSVGGVRAVAHGLDAGSERVTVNSSHCSRPPTPSVHRSSRARAASDDWAVAPADRCAAAPKAPRARG